MKEADPLLNRHQQPVHLTNFLPCHSSIPDYLLSYSLEQNNAAIDHLDLLIILLESSLRQKHPLSSTLQLLLHESLLLPNHGDQQRRADLMVDEPVQNSLLVGRRQQGQQIPFGLQIALKSKYLGVDELTLGNRSQGLEIADELFDSRMTGLQLLQQSTCYVLC